MRKQSLYILCLLCIPYIGYGAGPIVISEVVFDPPGIDTGLEYIVVKNIGTTSVDLTGWDIYPDGIGYFTFPNFQLGSQKVVTLFLRKEGENTNSSLYVPNANGNMGNSSGSIALFSRKDHSVETIVSYMRYHKSGGTERKTWETSAVKKNIWKPGVFIDVSYFIEGNSIFFTGEGLYSTTTMGTFVSKVASEGKTQEKVSAKSSGRKSSITSEQNVKRTSSAESKSSVVYEDPGSDDLGSAVASASGWYSFLTYKKIIPFLLGILIAGVIVLVLFVIKRVVSRYNRVT